jgi:hypothetical protein
VELVPDNISHSTIEALTLLLERAKTGEISGIAYGVILHRRRYVVETAGTARKYPTFARGMVQALDDHLSDLIHDR